MSLRVGEAAMAAHGGGPSGQAPSTVPVPQGPIGVMMGAGCPVWPRGALAAGRAATKVVASSGCNGVPPGHAPTPQMLRAYLVAAAAHLGALAEHTRKKAGQQDDFVCKLKKTTPNCFLTHDSWFYPLSS